MLSLQGAMPLFEVVLLVNRPISSNGATLMMDSVWVTLAREALNLKGSF